MKKTYTHLQVQNVLIKYALSAVLNSSCVKLPKAIILARVFGDALLFLNADIPKMHNIKIDNLSINYYIWLSLKDSLI